MAQRVVDDLELVEVEAEQHRRLPVPGVAGDRLGEAVPEQHAVRQPGERVVVRHVGDAGLGPPAFRHVDGGFEHGLPPLERHRPLEQGDLDRRAVGAPVEGAGGRQAEPRRRVGGHGEIGRRPAQELLAAVAVMGDGRVVDRQEAVARVGHDPHRDRVVLEQEPERGLPGLDVADIRHGDREEIADAARLDLEVERAAVGPGAAQLEGGAPAPLDHGGERRDRPRGDRPREELADALPLQDRGGPLQEALGAAVEGDDLEIDRVARRVTDRAEGQDPLVGGGEHRLDEFGPDARPVEPDQHERLAPAVVEGHTDEAGRGHDAGIQAIAPAVGGLAGSEGGRDHLADGLAQLDRERVDRDGLAGTGFRRRTFRPLREPGAEFLARPEDPGGLAVPGGHQGGPVGEAAEAPEHDGLVGRDRRPRRPAILPAPKDVAARLSVVVVRGHRAAPVVHRGPGSWDFV